MSMTVEEAVKEIDGSTVQVIYGMNSSYHKAIDTLLRAVRNIDNVVDELDKKIENYKSDTQFDEGFVTGLATARALVSEIKRIS